MRFTVSNLGCAGLCLAIWLCGAMGSPALGGERASEYDYLINPRNFQVSTYRIRVPDVADPNYQIPVVVILHDAGRTSTSIIGDENLVKAFINKGYAVLAPDALPRRNARINYRGDRPRIAERGWVWLPFSYSDKRFVMTGSDGTTRVIKHGIDSGWYFYNIDRVRYSQGDGAQNQPKFERLGRDEIQNLRNVLRNAEEEFGIDPEPLLIIGLGHGGSLVWQIACHAPNLADLLAPVGGAYWRKLPKGCKSGANLIHTHHRASAFWPMAGVKGRKKRYARTSIYRNLEMLLAANRCGADKTTVRNDEFGVSHTTWADCAGGGPVGLMLLDKPFAFQTWWLDEMLARIEPFRPERPTEAPETPVETGPEFKAAGAETGFKAPGTGTGFKTPVAGAGPRFKRAK